MLTTDARAWRPGNEAIGFMRKSQVLLLQFVISINYDVNFSDIM